MSKVNLEEVAGVIFDLDDTLISSSLCFRSIKQEIGCAAEQDILSFVAELPLSKRTHAIDLIIHYEMEDAQQATWMPYAKAFVSKLIAKQLPLAIVTRNCRAATLVKVKNNSIPISTIVTREDAPPKPNPDALLQIAKKWNLPSNKIAYVGDYIYDIEAAHNANMQAWLYQANVNHTSYLASLSLIKKE